LVSLRSPETNLVCGYSRQQKRIKAVKRGESPRWRNTTLPWLKWHQTVPLKQYDGDSIGLRAKEYAYLKFFPSLAPNLPKTLRRLPQKKARTRSLGDVWFHCVRLKPIWFADIADITETHKGSEGRRIAEVAKYHVRRHVVQQRHIYCGVAITVQTAERRLRFTAVLTTAPSTVKTATKRDLSN